MDEVVHLTDVLGHILVLTVRKVEDEVADFSEFFLGRVVDADNMSYPMPAQFVQVSGVFCAANKETRDNLAHTPLPNVA